MQTVDQSGVGPGSRALLIFLVPTAALTGALVMAIEILGSRVIGPFFGVSLFVWTALITVTLISLAAGYAAGGVIADRRQSPDTLFGIILLSGVLVLLVPLLKGPVLKASVELGLRAGALLSALALFGPSLFLLGCVSPFIIRIVAREIRNIGRTVGLFYALSTVGSFAGTLLTGYVLIAWFSVSRIFTVIGGLLIGLAAAYFLFFRGRRAAVATLALPVLLFPPELPVSKLTPNGTRVTRVHSRDGYYGNLKVVDYSGGSMHTRELMIDGLIQGGIDIRNRLPVYEYAYFLQYLPVSIHPGGKTCLVIGLGAGIVPVWYEERGVRTDVVDIDPDVVAVARKFFSFANSGEVFVADARYFLNTAGKRYDYVVLDVFNGDTTPGHLLSLEALRAVKGRMTERGVLAVNLVGSLRRETYMTASIVRTLEAVFRSVAIHPNFDPAEGEGTGNITVIARDVSGPPPDPNAFSGIPVHPLASERVVRGMARTFRFPEGTPAVILTDDYNPVDFYDTWLRERVRRNLLNSTDWDVMI
jgi:spermidine synthase